MNLKTITRTKLAFCTRLHRTRRRHLLIFLGVGLCWMFACQSHRIDAPVLETAVIASGNMENSVTATGTLEPIIQVEVGTQVSGIIDRIFVDYNSRVKANQVLAKLDRTVLEQELNSAQSDLNATKNEFDYQEKNFKRIESLHEKNMVSQSQYDEALYNYNRSQNSYHKAMASYKKAQTNLGYATIYSPIDGIVVSRNVNEGQTVAANFSTPTLFTIANNLADMQVMADVDEADIGQVAEGMEVEFSVDAFPDEKFRGKVVSVRIEPVTTNNVVTYEVVIEAPNPQEKLKPGMTANVNIYAMRKRDVLLLPIKAAHFEMPNAANEPQEEAAADEKTVWVKNAAGKPEKRKVKVGVSDGIYYEIMAGLNKGEEVYIGVQNPDTGAEEVRPQSGESPFMPKRPGDNRNQNRNPNGSRPDGGNRSTPQHS